MSYLHGGYDGIFPRVEQALEGKEAGYTCRVQLEPDDAFGEYEAALVRVEPRELFPAERQGRHAVRRQRRRLGRKPRLHGDRYHRRQVLRSTATIRWPARLWCFPVS